MKQALAALIGLCMVMSACTQRAVCPAFQSAFIYDKDALRKKFSYFKEDSTPKILTASKTKYLIAEPVTYTRKLQMLQTIEMKDVMPILPDSFKTQDEVSLAELDRAARSVIDSIYIVDVPQQRDSAQAAGDDSVYVITKDREVRVLRYNRDSIRYRVDEVRYNIDQDNYMWYLRDAIVLPDVRLSQLQANAPKEEVKEKKGIKGFFRDLFRKKEKVVETDSVQVAAEARSEFDLDYTEDMPDSTATTEETPPNQKKALLKKDKTRKKKTKPVQEKPVRKEEEQEDPLPVDEIEEDIEDDGGF